MGHFEMELLRSPALLTDNDGHWRGLDKLVVKTFTCVPWFNKF
jgi:hypothetical protein